MLNAEQIKLVQTAIHKAGIRKPGEDSRYRLLLAQYKDSKGRAIVSCKQLNNWQLDDILAICESHGWRMPGQSETFYRDKTAELTDSNTASYGQQEAIKFLAADLGFSSPHLANFIRYMTRDEKDSVACLSPSEAWKITEALTAIIRKQTGIKFKSLAEIRDYFFEKEGTVINGKEN